MKAPDKIYIGLTNSEFGGVVYDTVSATFPNAKEYIRKDALLEWIQEVRAIPHDNGISRDLAFQEVVNKLNSM